ncbi:MAG: dihydrofolate reductase [Candidatus Cloacimonetes bacterium]|nr:dihydrofolate reductase [Candidatus Cloacimonadota bacterium]
MSISIIVALDNNSLIGKQGKLPWHIPEDLAWFKEQTMGKIVVMGRKTWLSIGKPLPGRRNIVLTTDKDFSAEGAEIAYSVEEIMAIAKHNEVFITGGAEVFKQFLPLTDKLYLSFIDATFEGDTHFPPYDKEEWVLASHKSILSATGYPISFNIYSKITL